MSDLARNLYGASLAVDDLWQVTMETLARLDRSDRIAYFNAKRFACFQLAKILDNLQNPMRATYQSLASGWETQILKGPYPIFDNVAAIFSATPVITRTAAYLYACIEWVEDAFKGKELMHDIYSRLLNPTSISLANHIVDLEAGPLARDYMAWNFNSGMAAVDATLAHLVGYRDIVLSSRNVYGGTYQLLHDWYGKRGNMDVAVEWFDGFTATDFSAADRDPNQACRSIVQGGRHSMSIWNHRATRMATPWTFPGSRKPLMRRVATSFAMRRSARRFCKDCCSMSIRWRALISSFTPIPRTLPDPAPPRPASASVATSACSFPRASRLNQPRPMARNVNGTGTRRCSGTSIM